MVRAFLLALACFDCCSLAGQTAAPSAPAQACVKELPTPIRHVCGVIFTRKEPVRDDVFQQVHNATVTLMHNGTVVEKEETHERPWFNFETTLTDSSYDLIVEAENQTTSRFRIRVHKPIQNCSKGVLMLTLPLGAKCGDIYYKPNRYVDFDAPVEKREPAVQLASIVP